MKKLVSKAILMAGLAIFCTFKTAYAQIATLKWPGSTDLIIAAPSVCGVETKNVSINISFRLCGLYSGCNTTGCLIGNPYRATIVLFRNGIPVQSRTFNIASDWFNETFYNVQVNAGSSFYATVVFERKTDSCFGYKTIANVTTNTLNLPLIQGTPNFNINGVAVANLSPMNVCASNIRINGAATTCETDYFISIKECDQWLNRTYQYEVDVWFAGEAPDNINLQNIATAYSTGSYFTGPASRQGNALFGGNLPNGNARYYTVSLCVGPTFTCKNALIRVNGNCREAGGEDTNTYTVISSDEATGLAGSEGKSKIDKEELNISVFPNPSNSVFKVECERELKNATLSVFDYTGKEVVKTIISGSIARVDLTGYTKGMYIIVVNSDTAAASKTVILE